MPDKGLNVVYSELRLLLITNVNCVISTIAHVIKKCNFTDYFLLIFIIFYCMFLLYFNKQT